MSSSIDLVVALINKIDSNKFGKFLERIIAKLQLSPNTRPIDIFLFDEREKLITVFELESASELYSILEWSVKLFQSAGFEQMKVENLSEKLSKLNDEHAQAILRVWSAYGKSFIDRLKSKSLGNHQLIDVNFVLNADVASQARSQINQTTANLQFSTENIAGKTEKLALEFDHGQLVQLYDKMEDIQKQLDSLTG